MSQDVFSDKLCFCDYWDISLYLLRVSLARLIGKTINHGAL